MDCGDLFSEKSPNRLLTRARTSSITVMPYAWASNVGKELPESNCGEWSTTVA